MAGEGLAGYRFRVKIDQTELGFQKITGLSRGVEIQTYQEGGMNDRVHIFQKPTASENTLHLERGVFSGVSHPFYMAGERISSLRLEVLDELGAVAKSYTCTGLVVKHWETGALDAMGSALFIDQFELAYEALEVG